MRAITVSRTENVVIGAFAPDRRQHRDNALLQANRRGYVVKAERESGGLRIKAEIETVMKFMRDYRIVRQAMAAIDPILVKRAAPECRYVVIDAQGRVALAGVVRLEEDLTFRIPLDGELEPGSYTVEVEILVNNNAMNAEIEKTPVMIGGR